jgi:hypothetical protein
LSFFCWRRRIGGGIGIRRLRDERLGSIVFVDSDSFGVIDLAALEAEGWYCTLVIAGGVGF